MPGNGNGKKPEKPRDVQKEMVFDLRLGRQLRDKGMDLAAKSHPEILAIAIREAFQLALRKPSSMDDVHWRLGEMDPNYHSGVLGMAAGSVFKGESFQRIGTKFSERACRHCNPIGVYIIKGQYYPEEVLCAYTRPS